MSSLLLCLQQNYGPTEIVVIIFPSNTPKVWRKRGSSSSGDRHYYSSWFLLWKIVRFSSLFPFTPQHQALEANGESANTFTFSIGKFRVSSGQTGCGGCLGMGAARSRPEVMQFLDERRRHLISMAKGLQWRWEWVQIQFVCLGSLEDIWEESNSRTKTKTEWALKFCTGMCLT